MRPALAALLFATAPLFAGTLDLPTIKFGKVDYVNLEDGATRLGLRLVHSVPDTTVMLKSGAQPVARLADQSRQIDLLGLRIFLGDPVKARGDTFYISRIDFEDRIVPRLRPDMCGAIPAVPHFIVIDPGHGGPDPGGINKALGTMEKTYTLDTSLRLRKLLEAAGYKVVLTRETDVDLPKPSRAEIANVAGADFFVSVHYNVVQHDTTTTGVEVMLFPPATQWSADSWSPGQKVFVEAKESPVNRFDAWNSVLGGALHKRLLEALHDGDRGEKFEHLAVLRGLKCPGVLVEPAFISSNAEAAKLGTAAFRDTIAAAIFAGIQDYVGQIKALHIAQVPAHVPAQVPAAGPVSRSQPTRPTSP
jgi:N-acetylmuramoyl-L-alanine amidase